MEAEFYLGLRRPFLKSKLVHLKKSFFSKIVILTQNWSNVDVSDFKICPNQNLSSLGKQKCVKSGNFKVSNLAQSKTESLTIQKVLTRSGNNEHRSSCCIFLKSALTFHCIKCLSTLDNYGLQRGFQGFVEARRALGTFCAK